ncbi:MAG: acetyl-CoA decarbonylase/synthase complex subunit gamma, partial [Spirochaetota bacterium]
MALTALDVYKFLPKTNCKECKFPTCLAFAMALAQKKATLDDCKHASADAKAALEGASRPPVTLVTIGSGDKKLEIGNDTVLFRHEATFVHPAGIAVEVSDTMSTADLAKAAEEIRGLSFERVGMDIAVNLVAVRADSGNGEKFAAAVKIMKEGTGLPLVLMGAKAEVLEPALKLLAGEKPLICFADKDNVAEMAALAKTYSAPLAVTGSGLEDLAETAQKASGLGAASLVLCPKGASLGDTLQDLTRIRIAALKKNFRALGYPMMAIASNANPDIEAATAATFIAKYAGIVVVKGRSRAEILPILTARQNIYTDPQKPIQVKPGYYAVGNATPTSPVPPTPNFPLTYYTEPAYVEPSPIPPWVLVVDTE